MNKICLSIIALAALSSAAYANNRSYELRDSDTYFGKYSTQLKDKATKETMTVVTPLAVEEKFGGWTNFDRLKKISEENDHGRH
jgi:hypothetical protein